MRLTPKPGSRCLRGANRDFSPRSVAHEIGQMSDVTNILRICPENVQHQRSHAGRIDGSTTGPSLSLLSKDSDFPFNTRFADLKPYSILARGHKLGLFAV